MGLPALRQAIARHLTRWGLETTEEQVLVTHGAQQAIGLAGALFLERGDAVIVENPTYLGSIDIFSGLSARLVSVPVGGDAAWVSLVKETVARTAPRLLYLMPTFQNPTGAVLPAAGRRALARLSRELQIPIVEDNTLADLSLGASPPPPIASFDREAPILTIGSLSKLFWGGLRIGWIRGSEEILARITRLKIMADLGGSLIGQLVAVRLLAEAERVKAIRRREMRARLDLLTKLLSRAPSGLDVGSSRGRPLALGSDSAGRCQQLRAGGAAARGRGRSGQPRLSRRRLHRPAADSLRPGGRADARGRRADGPGVGGLRRRRSPQALGGRRAGLGRLYGAGAFR